MALVHPCTSRGRRLPPQGAPVFAPGFTLIELLVVIVILAILAAAVSIALAGTGGERQLERESERLEALLTYACERAELGGRRIGVTFRNEGYFFSEPDPSQRDEEIWIPMTAGELRERQWAGAFQPMLSRDGVRVDLADTKSDKPHVVCFASGELTPFRLELALADLPYRWRLDAEPDGGIRRERRDAVR